jgi:signal transduction histidine kinase
MQGPVVDYQIVFDQGSAICMVLAPDAPHFSVLAVSDAYLTLSGEVRSEVIGKGTFDVLSRGALCVVGAQADALRASLAAGLASRAPQRLGVEHGEAQRSGPVAKRRRSNLELVPMTAQSGELAYLGLSLAPADLMPEDAGATLRAKGLERELDERRRDLENALGVLEAFCYSVSHDLRAPLRAIDGFSQALAHDYGSVLDVQAHHYIDRVRAGAQRMSALIDDMLELSRIQRAPLRRSQVNLSELSARILAELARAEPDRKVSVEITPGLIANGDAHLMQVLLEKLLGNAWKFTSKKPQAAIQVGREASAPETFFVADDGAGFDMAYAGRLFSPFQRLHKASEFDGTGIGLAVAHRILSRHAGRIRAQAEPGKGARFSFEVGAMNE